MIFIRSENTLVCSNESNEYLKGPQSSPKQYLIVSKFISLETGLLFNLRKRSIFQFVCWKKLTGSADSL